MITSTQRIYSGRADFAHTPVADWLRRCHGAPDPRYTLVWIEIEGWPLQTSLAVVDDFGSLTHVRTLH